MLLCPDSAFFFFCFTSFAKNDDDIPIGDAFDHPLGKTDTARDHFERLVRIQGRAGTL